MAAEDSREGEFAELMTDHFFGHEDLQKRLAVVDEEGVVDKFRENRASAGPGLDRLFLAFSIQLFNLLEKLGVDVRTFIL